MDDSSSSTAPVINTTLTLIGAAVGGAIGYFTFGWLVRQGFYAPAIPGVLLGVGGGLLAKQRALALAVICGVLAMILCLIAECGIFRLCVTTAFPISSRISPISNRSP